MTHAVSGLNPIRMIQYDLSYDPSVPSRKFDFYPSQSGGHAPLVVMLHGGGWISGDRTMYADEAAWYAEQGFHAACISYRLAPLFPFPAAVADVQTFLGFCRQNHDSLGVIPDQVFALGNSAGGHLACMAGLCETNLETDEPSQPANAVVSICGITDIRNPEESQMPISMSFIEQFMGGSHTGNEDQWALASPITHITEDAPPFLIMHGTEDEIVPVDQARALYANLCSKGVPASLHLLDGENHSFSLNAWNKMRSLAIDFLRSI